MEILGWEFRISLSKFVPDRSVPIIKMGSIYYCAIKDASYGRRFSFKYPGLFLN